MKFRKTLFGVTLLSAVSAFAQNPLIGITSDFEANADTVGYMTTMMSYVNAVVESGGTPVVLPPVRSEQAIDDYRTRLDGLLLVGGLDVWPSFYGEKAHPTVDSMAQKRLWFESRLIDAWLRQSDKPILGICLGCQFTNVVCGGTLIQDIPSEIPNARRHREAEHDVTVAKESRLHRILGGERLVVNSWHHQAVKTVGAGLTVVAHADDGVIEALELPGECFGLFVQWHPERLPEAHRRKIFGAFIDACR